MNTNRQWINIQRQVAGIPKVGFIIAAVMVVLAILMLLHSRSKNAVSPLEIMLGTPQDPSGESMVFSQGDVTVYLPAGATDLEGTISIAAAEPSLLLLVDDTGWIPIKVVNLEFRSMEGAPIPGVTFSKPLEVCFILAEELWQAFSENSDAFRIQYYAAQKYPSRWESLPQVTYSDRRQLCGQTEQLSLFALAVQEDIGIPVTGMTSAYVPVVTRNRDRRGSDNADSASVPAVIPTNPPAAEVPLVQPTDPPAADNPSVNEDKQKDDKKENEKKEEKKEENKNNEEPKQENNNDKKEKKKKD